MKKFAYAVAALGLAVHASAVELKGIGWDNNLGHVTTRLGITDFANVDLGLALGYDDTRNAPGQEKFSLGLSALFLGHLHNWGPVDNYFAGGLVFNMAPIEDDRVSVDLFAGLQPEVTLLDRIAVGVRFGVNMRMQPDFVMSTVGDPISVVSGFNFKVLLGGGGGSSGSSYGSGSSGSTYGGSSTEGSTYTPSSPSSF